jgi:hypothetical protein
MGGVEMDQVEMTDMDRLLNYLESRIESYEREVQRLEGLREGVQEALMAGRNFKEDAAKRKALKNA